MESEAESMDGRDGRLEPLNDLWLAAGPHRLYYKQSAGKTVKATELKLLVKERKELRGRCSGCDSHPHCGVWGTQQGEVLGDGQ
jgi:hypothetical protein